MFKLSKSVLSALVGSYICELKQIFKKNVFV